MVDFTRRPSTFQQIREIGTLLNRKDKFSLLGIGIAQFLFSILDLIGVGLIGAIGALTVNGIQSKPAGDRVSRLLVIFHLSEKSFHQQILLLGTLSAFLLIGKTVISFFFTKRTMYFLSYRTAKLSSDIYAKILKGEFSYIKKNRSQNLVYGITSGVNSLVVGVMGSVSNVITDISLFLVIFSGLVFLDFKVAMMSLVLFGAIGLILYYQQNTRARELSSRNSNLVVIGQEQIIESLSAYREIFVRNRINNYIEKFRLNRSEVANIQGALSFLPQVSKYVLEVSIVVGTLLITLIQFYSQDNARAIGNLTIFIAAGARLGPAVLRIQQNAVGIKSNIAAGQPTLTIIEDLRFMEIENPKDDKEGAYGEHSKFEAKLEFDNVSYKHEPTSEFEIKDITFSLSPGDSLALVGPSGAGKSTLADLILGIIEPNKGKILLSGASPRISIKTWSKHIAYVSQEVPIIRGSIRENLALGFEINNFTDEEYWDSLDVANLRDYVEALPDGIDSEVGERGSRLSGGQRQRLGIARALVTKPQFMMMDEATSSLDSGNEENISQTLSKIGTHCISIIIAHRYSTIRKCNKILYLENGEIISFGSFDKVMAEVPEFARIATSNIRESAE
jgi:ATP-binding cassette subfamily C protein